MTIKSLNIAGCPEPDVFITNPKGELYSINGYRIAPSKYPERKVLSRANYGLPRDQRMTQKQLMDRMNTFVYNPQKEEWLYQDDGIPEDFLRHAKSLRHPKYAKPKRLFKQVFFDDVKEDLFREIEGHDGISNQTKAVINNATLAAMYKELIVNDLLRTMRIDPNEVAQVNKLKKTKEFNENLVGIITSIQLMNNEQAGPLFDAARRIYHDVAQQVLTNQENAVQQREVRTTNRNQTYTRRIGEMRGDRQIDRIQFGARPEYNFSPGRRRQRAQQLLQTPSPSPDDSVLLTPVRPQDDS